MKGPPTFSVYYQFFEYVNDKLPRGLILSINTTYLVFLSTGLILSMFYNQDCQSKENAAKKKYIDAENKVLISHKRKTSKGC